MIKRIFVELDKTPASDSVVKYAVELAKAHEAKLTGVTVMDVKKMGDVGSMLPGTAGSVVQSYDDQMAMVERVIREKTAQFTAMCDSEGIDYRVEHERGDAYPIMISKARYHDLFLIGLRSLFDYRVVNEPEHILERLVREGVRPILAIPGQYRTIKRVLIAYSGSLHSAEAMKQFLQNQLWPDVVVRIVYFGRDSEKASQILSDGVSHCQLHGFSADALHLPGDGPQVLLQHAKEWKADLIVLGNTMKNVLMKEVFGNVTHYLIENSPKLLFLSQ